MTYLRHMYIKCINYMFWERFIKLKSSFRKLSSNFKVNNLGQNNVPFHQQPSPKVFVGLTAFVRKCLKSNVVVWLNMHTYIHTSENKHFIWSFVIELFKMTIFYSHMTVCMSNELHTLKQSSSTNRKYFSDYGNIIKQLH
jgi:hypothetical protein